MKVTQQMIDAFSAAPIPHGWKRDELLTAQLQAVLDLIVMDPGHQVYYRAITPDRTVWAESGNPTDFPCRPPRDAADRPLTYQKIEIDTMTSGWQEWTP